NGPHCWRSRFVENSKNVVKNYQILRHDKVNCCLFLSITVLSLQTVRILVSLKDVDRSGKLNDHKFQELQSYVSGVKNEYLNFQREKSGAVDESQMKSALTAHDLRLNNLNFSLLWDRYSTAGQISYDDFVAILGRLETLKERFKSHRMTNLPCDCVMASFSLDDFIRDTLL
uniref:EF-hand domain-containing protein n=1 Tax=Astyanax mexicanus TaxID=7994 RepID=A0A3B1KLJ2_ASTMX